MKVTDKRRFTADGEAKEDDVARSDDGEAGAAAGADAGAGAGAGAAAEADAGARVPRGPIDFATFVESLATVALMHMGLVEVRGEEKLPVNLEFAKEQIDILGILEEKTHGNLTPDEAQLLAAVLSDLRLAYVRLLREGPRSS